MPSPTVERFIIGVPNVRSQMHNPHIRYNVNFKSTSLFILFILSLCVDMQKLFSVQIFLQGPVGNNFILQDKGNKMNKYVKGCSAPR